MAGLPPPTEKFRVCRRGRANPKILMASATLACPQRRLHVDPWPAAAATGRGIALAGLARPERSCRSHGCTCHPPPAAGEARLVMAATNRTSLCDRPRVRFPSPWVTCQPNHRLMAANSRVTHFNATLPRRRHHDCCHSLLQHRVVQGASRRCLAAPARSAEATERPAARRTALLCPRRRAGVHQLCHARAAA